MGETETRLSAEEKAFAEENVGILFAFMRRYRLPEDYFGALAVAYVQFVGKYLPEKEKHAYSFSTLMWQRLRSELSHIVRKEKSAQLIALTNETHETISQEDNYFAQETMIELRHLLTSKQAQALLYRTEGYTNAQIASMTGVTERAIEKRFSKIRKACRKSRGDN